MAQNKTSKKRLPALCQNFPVRRGRQRLFLLIRAAAPAWPSCSQPDLWRPKVPIMASKAVVVVAALLLLGAPPKSERVAFRGAGRVTGGSRAPTHRLTAAGHVVGAQPPRLLVAPAPESEGGCLQVGPILLTACSAEREIIQRAYPLSGAAAATPEQTTQVSAALRAPGIPSARCCAVAAEFAAEQCPCDSVLAVVLPSIGVQPVALQSAIAILAGACATFTAPKC